jgi:hypothetical protein
MLQNASKICLGTCCYEGAILTNRRAGRTRGASGIFPVQPETNNLAGEEDGRLETESGSPESSGAGPELVALGETVADMVAEERDTLTPESFITMAANKDNIAGS